MSLKDPLLSVSLFCHLASIILCALILSETLALYKSFTYLLTYLNNFLVRGSNANLKKNNFKNYLDPAPTCYAVIRVELRYPNA